MSKTSHTIRLGNIQVRYLRSKKTRCHAYESQRYYYYLDAFRGLFRKRFWCGVGAVYLALSNPVAMAHVGALQAPPTPKPITNPLLVKVPDLAPLAPTTLIEQPAVVLVPPVPVYVASTPVIGCGSDPNMAFIYQHESGCNTASINSIGCAGLGQACPGSKLPCSLSDWVCQDNFFRAYAVSVYGSTYQAMLAWQSKGWW